MGLLQGNRFAIVVLAAIFSAMAHAETDPANPSTDPRDITGIWHGTGFREAGHRFFKPKEGGEPPFTPLGQATYKERRDAEDAGRPIRDPASECTPHGVPGSSLSPEPFQIIQTPGQTTFVFEVDHDRRIIRMGGQHPAHLKPTFMGDSVGQWEGDTLVVDTVGLRDDVWLDFPGTPASAKLRVVERFKKIKDGKILDTDITIIDPVMYTSRLSDWGAILRLFWLESAHGTLRPL